MDQHVMNRTDHDDGKRFAYKGKISSEVDSVADGEISGIVDGIVVRFTAYWECS